MMFSGKTKTQFYPMSFMNDALHIIHDLTFEYTFLHFMHVNKISFIFFVHAL